MVGNLSTSSSMAAFEKMEEKVLRMEAESEAVQGLFFVIEYISHVFIVGLLPDDSLEEKFAALEGGSLEDEFAKLKGEIAPSRSAELKTLPEGRKVKDAIDVELEELRRKANEE